MMRTPTYPFQELSSWELPGEVWKDIPDTDGHYQISNKGRARRLAHRVTSVTGASVPLPQLIICQQTKKKASAAGEGKFRFHLNFDVTVGGKRRHVNTARLVCHLFVEPFDLGRKDLFVLYRDDDSLNVSADNLYVGTVKDKARLAAARLDPQGAIVSQYTTDGRLVATYPDNSAAAEAVGISPSSIRDAINDRNRFTAAGFVWRKGDAARVGVRQGKSKKGKSPFLAVSQVSKKVSQYSYEGILVRSYGGINEASRDTGVTRSSIQRTLSGRYVSAGGYLWAYGDSLRIDLRDFKQHPGFAQSAFGKYVLEKRQRNLDKLAERNPSASPEGEFRRGKLVAARNLIIDFGFTDEQVAKAVELPLDEIQRLRGRIQSAELS